MFKIDNPPQICGGKYEVKDLVNPSVLQGVIIEFRVEQCCTMYVPMVNHGVCMYVPMVNHDASLFATLQLGNEVLPLLSIMVHVCNYGQSWCMYVCTYGQSWCMYVCTYGQSWLIYVSMVNHGACMYQWSIMVYVHILLCIRKSFVC